jgi:NADH-quinone oxidoreductase subunit I
MTNEYELADSSRESLIFTKEQLLAGLEETMVDSPHAIYPGMDEQDYYRGLVTEAAPGTVRQVAWSKGEVPESEPAAGAEPGVRVPPTGGAAPAGTGGEA